ncbi:hypothetical protein [Acetobacter persici]|uniref:hypothetical protein n=1 Tax=Acetobacter persici TaxID=1076596 RepID=UPI001BABFCA6|nr:hypothetical protein [Acetobacter persici]MBS0962062.1 hypothetical protein [Acetobacter persici]
MPNRPLHSGDDDLYDNSAEDEAYELMLLQQEEDEEERQRAEESEDIIEEMTNYADHYLGDNQDDEFPDEDQDY